MDIYSVIVTSDEFGPWHGPRDLSHRSSAEAAHLEYRRQRDRRLQSHRFRRVSEVDNDIVKMCVLRDIDGYTTSICVVKGTLC